MENTYNSYYNNPYNTQPQDYPDGQTSYYPAMNYHGLHYSAGYYNNNIDNPVFQQSTTRSTYGDGFVPAPNYNYSKPENYETRIHKKEREKRRDRKRSRSDERFDERYYRHHKHRYQPFYHDHSVKEKSTERFAKEVYAIKPITITGLHWPFFIELYSKIKLQGQILNKFVFTEIPLIINYTKKTIDIKDKRTLWYFWGAYDSYKAHEYIEGRSVSPQNVLSLMEKHDQTRCKEMIEKALKTVKKSHNSYEYLIHVSTNRMIKNIDDINLDDVCSQASVMKQPTVSLYSSAENETKNISNVSNQCCYLQMASMEQKWYTLGYTFRNTMYLYKHPQANFS